LPAKDLCIGDVLSTGATVAGVIQKEVSEWATLPTMERVSASTLMWNTQTGRWERLSARYPVTRSPPESAMSFVVTPHSQLELASGFFVRDYMEVCSPDTEQYYAKYLESHKSLAC
jgi:hypothetical protein